jgi:3-(3-hydroxy-phenyl)propionate hydroxylase
MSEHERHAEEVSVLIVGAGPTGVAAATMLAQRGVDSLVIDRYPGIYPLPRAVHLDDEIYRVLQGMGAAEGFTAITEPRKGLVIVDSALRPMATFDRTKPVGDHGWPQANFFDQPELERVLRDTLAQYPLARLTGRRELVGYEQGIAGGVAPVRAVVRDLDTGSESIVWAQAILGCDGANSTVRELMGATLLDLGFEERWLVVDIGSSVPLDVWDGVYQVSDSKRPATFMQVVPGRYRWEFRLHPGERIEDMCTPDVLSGLMRPWTKEIPFSTFTLLRSAEYTFRARIADRWQDRRVFLLGDAAHLTPPFIGQGLCAAMRDASNLTWKLAAVLRGGAPETLLDTYAQERPEPARGLVKKAVTIGTVMTGGPSYLSHLRRILLAAACRLPGISDKVLDTPAPPLAPSAIVRRARGRSLPGSPIPQPWVVVAGARRRLDDILGSGLAIVTTTAPDGETVALAAELSAPLILVSTSEVPAALRIGVDIVAVDEAGVLTNWLASAGTTGVLVRPDRAVLAQVPRGRTTFDKADVDPALIGRLVLAERGHGADHG